MTPVQVTECSLEKFTIARVLSKASATSNPLEITLRPEDPSIPELPSVPYTSSVRSTLHYSEVFPLPKVQLQVRSFERQSPEISAYRYAAPSSPCS